MRQIVAACWTAKREEGAGAGGGRRHGGTEGGAGGRGRSLEVVEKERKGDGRDALYRGVMDASRGWFRLGLAATSVKVIVIGGTGEREIYSLRVDFFSFPPFFFFFSTPVVSATSFTPIIGGTVRCTFFPLRKNLFVPVNFLLYL